MGTQAAIVNDALAHMANYSTSLRIAWPNQNFDPGNDSMWLEVRIFPNTSREIVWDNGPQYLRGFIQVSVYAHPSTSIIRILNETDSIATHFAKGTQFGATLVSGKPSIAPPVEDGAVIFTPVTISYIGVA